MKYLLLGLVSTLLVCSCASEDSSNEGEPNDADETSFAAYIVDVTTTSMEFQAPDTIKSGWVTLKYENKSPMVHLALLDKLPDGKTIKDHQDTIAPLFQNIMDQINGREMSEPGVGTSPPDWMAEIVYIGGPGLISPGKTAVTTMYLTPGTYVLECYVKTNKVFHTYNPDPRVYGMIHQFIVTEEKANVNEPEASVSIDISTSDGMIVKEEIPPGDHVIAVHYLDQKVYPNFLQHDVQLIKNEGGNMDSLLNWINWMEPTGLETPAPEGFTFLGGLHEMPAGSTGYFRSTFEPGEYILLSEVPRPDTSGLLKTLTVAEQQ